MTYWFTSDTHFDHRNIIKYTKRPFETLEEMNEELISKWNEKVNPGDVVYHLGDFAFHRHKYFAERLNGLIVLITGSHDRMDAKSRKAFQCVGRVHIFKGNPDIILSHYAHRVWERSHYGTWHLFGHSHGNLESWGKSFDCGVDAQNFYPISLEQVTERMNILKVEDGVDRRYKLDQSQP